MGRNLGPLNIKDSYEGLVQISGSQLTDGSGSLIPSLDVSASYATTASFALNVTPTPTGSFMVTGSVTDATLTFTKGDASTFPLTVNNVANAVSASHAVSSDTSISSSHAVFADTAGGATDVNALYTASVSDATISFLKGGGGTFPITINNVANAVTAQTASFLPADTNLNINSISASNATFTSASIGYLQSITGSAKIIGDAFIILNNNTPTQRFAGLVVQDSGSTNNTASFEFDGQTNDWFYEYTDDGGATTEHGVALFGAEYNTKGSPSYPATNVLQKGNGGHHLLDSSITDDGTLVSIDANVSASGYVSASSFIGDGSQLTGLGAGGEFQPATGVSSSVSIYQPASSVSSPDSIMFSSGSSITSTLGWNGIFAGRENSISGGQGVGQVIVGGFSNSITGNYAGGMIGTALSTLNAYNGFIGGGRTHTITSGDYTIIVGGDTNTASGNSNGVVGGGSNNASGVRSVIVGGFSNTLANTSQGIIAGGTSNRIDGGNDEGLFILGTKSGGVQINGGKSAGLVGGWNNKLYNFDGTSGDITTGLSREVVGGIIFGNSNFIGQGTLGSPGSGRNGCPIIIGGMYNQIGATTTNGGTFTKMSTILNSSASYVDSGSFQGVIGGYENYVSGSDNAYIIASNNSTIDSHNNSVIIGGSGFTTTKNDEVVVPSLSVYGEIEQGDTNSNLGTNTAILSSGHSLISASVVNTSIIASSGSYQSSTQPGRTAIIASDNSYIDSTSAGNNDDIAIIGSLSSRFTGGGARQAVMMATNNSYNNGSRFSAVIGGEQNKMEGFYANVIAGGSGNKMSRATNSTIAGGNTNTIGSVGQADNGFVGGGQSNLLNGDNAGIIAGTGNNNSQLRAVILGGENNTINGGQGGVIVGGANGNVGHNYSVVLGGFGLSTTKGNEVVVEHLSTNGAVVQDVKALTISANVAEIDASLGNLFTLTLQNGVNTELQLTNQSAGQTFQVQITNNATSAGTITFDSQFEFEGGAAFTATAATSAVDILTFTCFGGGNVQCVSAKNFS